MKNVYINGRFKKLQDLRMSDIQIQFITYDEDGCPDLICAPLTFLLDDWLRNDILIPPNYSPIDMLLIFYNGRVEAVNTYELENLTFGEMMKTIKEVWGGFNNENSKGI